MPVVALDVDFYLSSTDGPTLRMAGGSEGIQMIRDACERLAGGEPSVGISDLAGVKCSANVQEVEFRLGGTDGLCRQVDDSPIFVFDGESVQWEARARLLDPLVGPATTGFQYLEPNVVEGICVEVERVR
jgi:hypothetical protein